MVGQCLTSKLLLLWDPAQMCSRCCFNIKMLLWDQGGGSWSGMFLHQAPPWILLLRCFKKQDGVCVSSKSQRDISWCVNWLCSWEYLCVLSLTHVACLMPVNYSQEQSTARPQMAAGSGCAVCCCLVSSAFCQDCNSDPERDLPASPQHEGTAPFPNLQLVPLLCLTATFLFLLILLRVLGQTFCEDEINSLLQKSFLNSVFLWGKSFCCLFLIQNWYWYSVYWSFTFEKNKPLQGGTGGQDIALMCQLVWGSWAFVASFIFKPNHEIDNSTQVVWTRLCYRERWVIPSFFFLIFFHI